MSGRKFVWGERKSCGCGGRLGLVAALIAGCGSVTAADDAGAGADASGADAGGPADSGVDETEALFRTDHVLRVEIDIDSGDWDQLRRQGHDLSVLAGDCTSGPRDQIYDFFPADVTIDGERVEMVGVRKKGFLGSITTERPSLKIKFDEYRAGVRFSGARRMTLNNNRQDPSLIRQCLAYRTFAAAGLATPRCSFAEVFVNGDSLGIYSHVESIKKPFIRRHFARDDGNLYEGQRSDFRSDLVATFEAKTNELAGDRSDLAQLTALLASESIDMEAVEEIVDVDEFMTYWAVESLVGHWDGYSNNLNNYYLYRDPGDSRFHFLPWGPDIAFTSVDPFNAGPRPASVSAHGRLSKRLWSDDGSRAAYHARMSQLLTDIWDEDDLAAEVDRLQALLGSRADSDGLAEIRDYIASRRAAIEGELDAGGADWSFEESGGECWQDMGPVSATFSTSWGTIDSLFPLTVGSADFQVELDGQPVVFSDTGAVAGIDKTFVQPVVRIVGRRSSGELLILQAVIEEGEYDAPADVAYHGFATFAGLLELSGLNLRLLGFVASGSVGFDQAGSSDGAPVSGQVTGRLYMQP